MDDFDFYKAYRLTDVHHGLFRQPMVVVGVYVDPDEGNSEKGLTSVMFMAASGGSANHQILGRMFPGADHDSIEIVDADRRAGDGAPIIWRFEPLTLERWADMQETIVDFDSLSEQFETEEQLQSYYLNTFLPEGYAETYEKHRKEWGRAEERVEGSKP